MSFPLECDGLSDSQLNDALLSVLGNIGGEKYILSGLTSASGYAGYVFLATQDFPSGELLYVEPATAMTSYLCLRKSNEDVTANGYPYVGAYTKRTLYHGVSGAGVESFTRSGFTQLETNASLKSRLDTLTTKVNSIIPTPVGAIIMWTSTVMPDSNWLPCDGRLVSKTTYSALYSRFGANKFGADTTSEFRLPNMQGRFPLMTGGNTGAAIAATGGAETHTLTVGQMPVHTHDFANRVVITSRDNPDFTGTRVAEANGTVRSTLASPNNAGGGQAHNNMPPWLALNFIIKVL